MTHRVLMYHGIVADNPVGQVSALQFEQQIAGLKRFFEFLTPEEYFSSKIRWFRKPGILLTFDDGYKNNLTVVAPILKKLQVPAIFFVSLRHCDQSKYLWFSHIRSIGQGFKGAEIVCAGVRYSMDASSRAQSLKAIHNRLFEAAGDPEALAKLLDELPKPESFMSSAELDGRWRGLTESEIKILGSDPLFEIASHTIEHPALSRCTDAVVEHELIESQSRLSSIVGRPIRYFAYPSGDYDTRAVEISRRYYQAAFAVRATVGVDPKHEIKRFGVYQPGLRSVLMKLLLGKWMRAFGIPVS